MIYPIQGSAFTYKSTPRFASRPVFLPLSSQGQPSYEAAVGTIRDFIFQEGKRRGDRLVVGSDIVDSPQLRSIVRMPQLDGVQIERSFDLAWADKPNRGLAGLFSAPNTSPMLVIDAQDIPNKLSGSGDAGYRHLRLYVNEQGELLRVEEGQGVSSLRVRAAKVEDQWTLLDVQNLIESYQAKHWSDHLPKEKLPPPVNRIHQ